MINRLFGEDKKTGWSDLQIPHLSSGQRPFTRFYDSGCCVFGAGIVETVDQSGSGITAYDRRMAAIVPGFIGAILQHHL